MLEVRITPGFFDWVDDDHIRATFTGEEIVYKSTAPVVTDVVVNENGTIDATKEIIEYHATGYK